MKEIFVFGYPRSGTTLLQALLCAQEGAAPLLGEALLPRLLAEGLRKHFATWQDDTRYFFADRDACMAFFREAFDRYLAGAAEKYGHPSVLVMKDPMLSREFAALRALRERGRFVGIVRDPRDVICSYADVERKKGAEITEATYRRLTEKVTSQWPGLYEPLANDTTPALTMVRYEDLAMDFEGTKRRLEQQLDCRLEANCESVWAGAEFDYLRSSPTRQRFFSSDDWGRPVTARRVGIHRRDLPRECAAIVLRTCGDLLLKLGYQVDASA